MHCTIFVAFSLKKHAWELRKIQNKTELLTEFISQEKRKIQTKTNLFNIRFLLVLPPKKKRENFIANAHLIKNSKIDFYFFLNLKNKNYKNTVATSENGGENSNIFEKRKNWKNKINLDAHTHFIINVFVVCWFRSFWQPSSSKCKRNSKQRHLCVYGGWKTVCFTIFTWWDAYATNIRIHTHVQNIAICSQSTAHKIVSKISFSFHRLRTVFECCLLNKERTRVWCNNTLIDERYGYGI